MRRRGWECGIRQVSNHNAAARQGGQALRCIAMAPSAAYCAAAAQAQEVADWQLVLAKLVWSDDIVIAGPVHIELPFPRDLATHARLRKSRDTINDRTRPMPTAWDRLGHVHPARSSRHEARA